MQQRPTKIPLELHNYIYEGKQHAQNTHTVPKEGKYKYYHTLMCCRILLEHY